MTLPCFHRENEKIKRKQRDYEKQVSTRDQEVDRAESKLNSLEVRIGQLVTEKAECMQETAAAKKQTMDTIEQMNGLKADKMFLQNQIDQLHDELKERDEAFQTLSNTLYEKGQQNKELSEALACFKN